MNELRYNVPGVTCDHCINAITRAVKALDKVSSVNIDLKTKLVTVSGADLDDAAVRAAIVEAGYEPDAAAPPSDSAALAVDAAQINEPKRARQ